MGFLIGLIRIALLGIIIGGLISVGLFFFAIVSVVLLVLGGAVWLKEKNVLHDPRQGPPVPPGRFEPEEVVVERKVIEADYEEVRRDSD